ncbi:MAG: DNA primase [Candidatus Shapirobacteria bacterium]|nr:DNA primase [Candidatus Shapirobacteria bacterium]
MDNQVEEIKQKLNIVDVINRFTPLKKRGRNHIACCPFHGEKTPSFTVSEELQIFKCFGCGKSGDIFTFIQEYERIDFREALTELAAMAGIVLKKSEFDNKQDSRKKVLSDLNSQVEKFYQYMLLTHPLGKNALDYVIKRGISLDTIKKFGLGYSPENPAIAVNFLTKKGYKIDDLIASGTFGKSQYNSRVYDRFQGRLTFPLSDYRGRILGFSGRMLPTTKNQDSGKYINSPETEIYHKSFNLFGLHLAKDFIRQQNAVIVTEGEFDMISPFQAGIKNIVAIKGTAFTEEQLQLLRRYTDTLILGLDSDFAGSNASRKSIELADSMEFDIKVLTLGEKYKDPDEAVRNDLEFFKTQLDQTVSIWDFIIQSQIKINNPDTIKGKKEILTVVLPFLVKIKNSVIRSDYLKKLANEIGSDYEALLEEAKKIPRTSPTPTKITVGHDINAATPKTNTVIEPSKTEKFEQLLLTLIIGAKNPAKLAKKVFSQLSRLQDHRFFIIGENLLKIEEFEPKSFEDLLPAEIKPVFQAIYMETTTNSIESHQRLLEIQKIVAILDSFYLKDRLNVVSSQIAQLESLGDDQQLAEAEKEYNRLLSELSKVQIKKS